jgi:type IV secretory pathway VirB2 component (pilin)
MQIDSSLADPSVLDGDAVASALGTSVQLGLSAPEAAARLARGGANELRSAPRVPAWCRILAHFQDPLVYLLAAAVVIALAAWVIEGRQGWPADAIVIALVVALNGSLGYAQEAKAENAVAALAGMTAATCSVVRDELVLRIPSAELVRGDVMELTEGDLVAADARLLRCRRELDRSSAASGLCISDAAHTARPHVGLEGTLEGPREQTERRRPADEECRAVGASPRSRIRGETTDTYVCQILAELQPTVLKDLYGHVEGSRALV